MNCHFIPYFTYTIRDSLYIPLTSRCNSLTLPQTRGPGFALPVTVVTSLCHVRDAEYQTSYWTQWVEGEKKKGYLTDQSYSLRLPDPIISESKQPSSGDGTRQSRQQRPSVSELIDECLQAGNIFKTNSFVIAGEGEPTLRLNVLEELVRTLLVEWKSQNQNNPPMIRVITNGLGTDIDSPRRVAERLKVCGVQMVSVAIMTHDAQQYMDLMKPSQGEVCTIRTPHEQVQEFIQCALQLGLDVELTAVDRPDVDQKRTNAMAKALGVAQPIRWRPYFP